MVSVVEEVVEGAKAMVARRDSCVASTAESSCS